MRAVFNVVMRIVSSLLGLLMIAMGSIWIMQGLRVGPEVIMRSFMAGDPKWAVYGLNRIQSRPAHAELVEAHG
jgi:hypothetical protein